MSIMRRLLSGLAIGMAWVGTANAAEAPARVEGFELGARLGTQLPGGESQKGRKLSDDVAAATMLGLDAGYRVNRLLHVGATLLWAPSLQYTACVGCSGSVLRPAVGVRIHPTEGLPVDPWLSLSIGWERVSFQTTFYDSIRRVEVERKSTTSGPEWLNLGVGADYPLLPALTLNAFVAYSIGRYTSVSDGALGDPAVHNWLSLGVGGRYRL